MLLRHDSFLYTCTIRYTNPASQIEKSQSRSMAGRLNIFVILLRILDIDDPKISQKFPHLYTCTTLLATFKDTALFFAC